ncbi:putative dUTP diphosphatase [Helianthus debilis subsp. tardiflorus]|nr:putative dUTP diphosphatase [Helianthus annuus]
MPWCSRVLKMAGTLGAITHSLPSPNILNPYKTYHHHHFIPFRSPLIYPPSKPASVSTMAQTLNGSPEIKEPTPKLQKLDDQNGNSDHQIPLFKVKKLSDKAVLPSRGSSLAAGYDLSSAVDTKVPARGKALVATDLSIAVPEGTYARIGRLLFNLYLGLNPKGLLRLRGLDWRGSTRLTLVRVLLMPITGLIVEKIVTPEVVEVDDLDSTVRGAGGFGSTGV